MDYTEKVVVACPKCGQLLRCDAGGAGTCPKCGTRVSFPESIFQADPDLNREALYRIAQQQAAQQIASSLPDEEDEPPRKKRSVLKMILLIVLILALLGGAVFGGLRLWSFLHQDSTPQDEAALPFSTSQILL